MDSFNGSILFDTPPYILYPVHGDKNHHKPDIFIGENIDTLNGF